MADSNHTPGTRFAESEFLEKTLKSNVSDHFLINSHPCFSPLIDEHIAELMETLRLHAVIIDHEVFRLPLPAQKRSRLVRSPCLIKAGELEYLVKEVRLLIDPAALSRLGEEVCLSP